MSAGRRRDGGPCGVPAPGLDHADHAANTLDDGPTNRFVAGTPRRMPALESEPEAVEPPRACRDTATDEQAWPFDSLPRGGNSARDHRAPRAAHYKTTVIHRTQPEPVHPDGRGQRDSRVARRQLQLAPSTNPQRVGRTIGARRRGSAPWRAVFLWVPLSSGGGSACAAAAGARATPGVFSRYRIAFFPRDHAAIVRIGSPHRV